MLQPNFFLFLFFYHKKPKKKPRRGREGAGQLAFAISFLAETDGFEPSRAFKPYLVSSEALSTTQPRLHMCLRTIIQEAAECSTSRPPTACLTASAVSASRNRIKHETIHVLST